MDWKNISSKFNPYITKMDPYIQTARSYGKKVATFAEEQIQTTPLFIHTQAEYDALGTEKRVILIAYDETQPVAQDVRMLSPIWLTRAFLDAACLRFISLGDSSDLVQNLGLSSPLDMRVIFQGQETLHITDIVDIKTWWQSPIYTKTQPTNQAPIDPLAGK